MVGSAFRSCFTGISKHGAIALRFGYRLQSTSTRVHRLGEPTQLIRTFPSGASAQARPHSDDFVLYENFFTLDESKQLLLMALWKLDRADTTRRRRRKGGSSESKTRSEEVLTDAAACKGSFRATMDLRRFGHYDSVIHQYRETLLSSFPPPTPAFADAPALMDRVYDLLPKSTTPQASPREGIDAQTWPPSGSTTHLLHLAPSGVILPHVDNLDASGSVIVGVSLGAERILRLSRKSGAAKCEGWDVTLPNGSVYVQRDVIRYSYEHSILGFGDAESTSQGASLVPGHRISIMVRDANTLTKS